MKTYICLNHGECNWADETPPREFSLPDGEDHFCPNCESANVKEKPKPPRPPWAKIAGALGLLLLIAGLVWLFWPPNTPRSLKIEVTGLDCKTGVLSLTTIHGDDSPITFSAEGLSMGQSTPNFTLPKSQRNGQMFTFFAVQNGDTSSVNYSTNCPIPPPPPPPPPLPPKVAGAYRRVEGSEFCIGDCILAYSETDNLGHTRERRIENYAECCPADK